MDRSPEHKEIAMMCWAKVVLVVAAAMLLGACEIVGPQDSEERELLHQRALASVADMKRADPSLDTLLNSSYAYVIFPRITAGAVGIGGAYGDGEMYQKGKLIGYADVSQGSVGVQLGGQTFAELIMFRTETAYVNFTHSTTEFDARASAVAASAGAARAADYSTGVLVIYNIEGGLMIQAAVGLQSFRFRPVLP
jgi:lipid-binding SYLF domain-containing protein